MPRWYRYPRKVPERCAGRLAQLGVQPGQGVVVVAYSGGADSTALLHALASAGYRLLAAHLHHGMRPEADSEMEGCRSFAESLRAGFAGERADVPRYAREHRTSLETAGRQLRREFLLRVREAADARAIATGHTADDQLETLLLRLARGTGVGGLGGIRPREGWFVRPLLEVRREEARRYCESRGLWFHDDPANADLRNARSRVRAKVVPELLGLFPGAREAAGRLAGQASALHGLACALAEEALGRIEAKPGLVPGLAALTQVRLSLAGLAAEPEALRPYIVRAAAARVGILLGHRQTVAAVEGLAKWPSGSVGAGPAGRVVWRDGLVRFEAAPSAFEPMKVGEAGAEGPGWRAGRGERAAEYSAWVRRAAVWEVRPLCPGDFVGGVRAWAALADAGVCASARRLVPVFCAGREAVWIPGVCLHPGWAATEHGEGAERLYVALGPGRSIRDPGTVAWPQT